MNRMNSGEAIAEQSFGLEQGNGTATVFLNAGGHFGHLLGDVHVHRQFAFVCISDNLAQVVQRYGAHAVRSESHPGTGDIQVSN